MASNPLNFKKNHADVVAAEAAIAPLLVSAKISTIRVGDKDVSAADAPLASKIEALGKLIATGDKTEDNAEAISANGILAGQNEKLSSELVAERATVAAQSQKIIELTGKLTVANDSLTRETADHLATKNLLKTTTDAGVRLTSEVAAQKLTVARACIKCAAVEFKGADGKALAADCSDSDLATASKDMTFNSMTDAYSGALHAAAGKLGITLATVPTGGTQTTAAKKLTATEEIRQAVLAEKRAGTWKGGEQ